MEMLAWLLIIGKNTQSFPIQCDIRCKTLKDALYPTEEIPSAPHFLKDFLKLKVGIKFCQISIIIYMIMWFQPFILLI